MASSAIPSAGKAVRKSRSISGPPLSGGIARASKPLRQSAAISVMRSERRRNCSGDKSIGFVVGDFTLQVYSRMRLRLPQHRDWTMLDTRVEGNPVGHEWSSPNCG